MSMIAETNRGGNCGICLEPFSRDCWRLFSREKEYAHLDPNGQLVNHDGFHRHCFEETLKHRRFCPYDQQPIDPRFPVSRTEKIMARVKPTLVTAATAAAFGLAAGAVVATGGAVVAGTLAIGAAVAAESLRLSPGPGEAAVVVTVISGVVGINGILFAPLTAIATTSLTLGAAAGILSLIGSR